MRYLKTIGFLASLCFVFQINSIYDYSFSKIEGGTQSMTSFQGKKILVITLPLEQDSGSDSMLYSLDTLAQAHSSTLSVIAVPSIEDGYTSAQHSQLQEWYRSKLGNYIIISEGIHTRKTSGAVQHELFKWLTKDTLNGNFDIDVSGPNCKFFVSPSGILHGALGPEAKIWGSNVQRALQTQQN